MSMIKDNTTLPRMNHRAPPITVDEAPADNEARYRGEIERALRQFDIAMRRIEVRLSGIEARLTALETP